MARVRVVRIANVAVMTAVTVNDHSHFGRELKALPCVTTKTTSRKLRIFPRAVLDSYFDQSGQRSATAASEAYVDGSAFYMLIPGFQDFGQPPSSKVITASLVWNEGPHSDRTVLKRAMEGQWHMFRLVNKQPKRFLRKFNGRLDGTKNSNVFNVLLINGLCVLKNDRSARPWECSHT